MRLSFLAFFLVLLAACGSGTDDGVVEVAFIADPGELDADGVRLDPAGQHVRAAISMGLVRIDPRGEVVPGVAERWIVTDDGASYIFRINEFDLRDGTPLTAQAVRNALQQRLRQLRGTSLGLDLAKVRDIRAMTGRVVEIRLTSPMPDFLRLLAQPELGIDIGDQSAALMARGVGDDGVMLAPLPPQLRGLPEQPGWEDTVGEVRMTSDLRIATAFVLPLGGQGKEEALEALRRNKHEIRHLVVKGGTMKFAPELRFEIDGTFDQIDATRALLAEDHVRQDLEE